MNAIRLVSPGKNGMVTNEYGKSEKPPVGWEFLPAGDAAITRKVTAQGNYWKVQVKKGRRLMSKGVWAPAGLIATAKKEVEAMRNAPDYARKRDNAAKSRQKKQEAYAKTFEQAVRDFLAFDERYEVIAQNMAIAITAHAIPIGSGTVARTAMIPLEERAAKAVIAWMRHQTTGYDHMKIARVKGERRNVRKQLAARSKSLLNVYRQGYEIPENCPLLIAVKKAAAKTP
ncbi:MAG: DUF2293 domain-containing protein [Cyclobacteriaceae bacterium]